MIAGIDPFLKAAGYLSLLSAALWAFLLVRWLTFSAVVWRPLGVELALAEWPPIVPYLIYGGLLALDLIIGIGLLRGMGWARTVGIGTAVVAILIALLYYFLLREFWGATILVAISGFKLLLLTRRTGWALAYPAAFWLGVFFVIPIIVVFIVSLGERTRLGTVAYPPLSPDNLLAYFDDYGRFFSRINGDFIYLRIFWRTVWIAIVNTIICLLVGYPLAYWIARQPIRYRSMLIFLVMIPFWTNFLVRTYAWMLILRDSGLINNFWSITLHEQAVLLADSSPLFAWLAEVTSNKLPLLFNQPAVMIGLFYGFLPFMVLPLYSNLEQLDWSLLEAAADLGANARQSFLRVLLPLSLPGIVAGSIIVFIPSLGAYVTPDLMGGARVSLLGNLLQQQFMTVRDWPFGSAIGFIMMAIMLAATLVYFRTLAKNQQMA
jgi:spermidine/putrescine transport system permease protein